MRMLWISRIILISCLAFAGVVYTVAGVWKWGRWPMPYVNLSASVPEGIYWVTLYDRTYEVPVDGQPQRGELALVDPDEGTQRLLVERNYLPAGTLLLKPVAAVAGDQVCIVEREVWINGENQHATVMEQDQEGRVMPQVWEGTCHSLAEDEVFLLSTHSPLSFDSRYFGPVQRSQIRGVGTYSPSVSRLMGFGEAQAQEDSWTPRK